MYIRQFLKAHKKNNDNFKIKEKIKPEKSEFMFQFPPLAAIVIIQYLDGFGAQFVSYQEINFEKRFEASFLPLALKGFLRKVHLLDLYMI